MPRKDPTYLCIDDESGDRIDAILDRLRRNGLDISLHTPAPFDEEVALIAASDADGLLLDLRLDDVPTTAGTRVRYRAVALAQELRTRMTEGDIAPLPIVLWSVERKFRKSFSADTTAHDLFDLVFSKNEVSSHPRTIAPKLIALAKDYPALSSSAARSAAFWPRALGIDARKRELLDPRIGVELRSAAPAHEYARYIVHELLERSGPLADEALVAARLGASVASPGWELVKRHLEPARYRGLFGAGWERWWWPQVETDLRELSPARPFRALTASERIDVLRTGWRIETLQVPDVPEGSSGSRYWYVCAATHAPLDPVDAVAAESGDRKPWQDRVYVSMNAVLSRRASAKGLRIHPLEQPRIDEITTR